MYLTHGMTKAPEYIAWANMRGRCRNPKDPGWPRYGGRGITVCEEWVNSFAAFFAHVGPRPSSAHSIDRIDNDKGYEPGNVRWADRLTQQQNIRSNVNLTYQGETHCLREWSRRCNIPFERLRGRHRAGWAVDRIFSDARFVVPDPERSMSFA